MRRRPFSITRVSARKVLRLALAAWLAVSGFEASSIRAAARPQAPMGFRIVVLEGEDGVNIIDKMTAVQPVVEVVDRNNLPVAGVAVVFLIRGNNATFANGARQVALTTDSAGRATVTGLNPVGRGSFDIQVRATYMGQNATATIHQTNLPTTPAQGNAGQAAGQAGAAGAGGVAAAGAGGGGHSLLTLAGIAGGAAVGGVVALKALKKDDSGPAPTPCNQPTVAGGDTPETHVIELGKSSGSFNFFFDTQNIPDRIVVSYEGTTLFDTTCVGAAGSRTLNYSGKSTKVTVNVTPNCAGGTSNTAWDFAVSCPN